MQKEVVDRMLANSTVVIFIAGQAFAKQEVIRCIPAPSATAEV